MFKSNLNEISRGRYKSEEEKCALENIKLLYESQVAVAELFNDYSSIVFEDKYKTIHGKRIPSISAHVACGRVAKVSDLKVSDQISKY